jgi:hypothetical protein
MDLNYLYLRHQVALHRADNAACERSREAHAELAGLYAEQIAERKSAHLTAVAA